MVLRCATLLLALCVLLAPGAARADIQPEPEEVPVETLQRMLCEQEQANDSCGEGARGEPLVCGKARCEDGPCLLCVRQGASTASDGHFPQDIHTQRLHADWRFEPARDPAVVKSTRIAGAGFALALLALLGFLVFPRRRPTPLIAGLALAAGIVTSVVGLVGRDMAEDAYKARYEEGREVLLIPVDASVGPTWGQRAAWQHHIDQLKRLLDAKGRRWRQHGS